MTRKLFDNYMIRLLKENILYIVLLLFFIIILGVYIPFQLSDYFTLIKKNQELHNELTQYKSKQDLVMTFTPAELNDIVSILNVLLPNKEDYFSILNTVETLSQKTGFKITSYKIGIAKKSTEIIQLSITGEGGTAPLMEFLNLYHTGGGRLISIDKIDYSTRLPKVTLSLLFYSHEFKGKDISSSIAIDKKTVDEVKRLPVPQSNQSESSNVNDLNYPVRANPFE